MAKYVAYFNCMVEVCMEVEVESIEDVPEIIKSMDLDELDIGDHSHTVIEIEDLLDIEEV